MKKFFFLKSLEDEKGLLILLEVLIDAYCLYFLSKMCITTTAISNICVSNDWFERMDFNAGRSRSKIAIRNWNNS